MEVEGDEKPQGPKIHNPHQAVEQWERDRAEVRRADNAILTLRHIKELTERVKRLEFEHGEDARQIDLLKERIGKLEAARPTARVKKVG